MALIGLISDVHAAPEPVAEALSVFHDAGVDQVLCAGDIAGYMDDLQSTVDLLLENDCMCIMGNHDLQYLEKYSDDNEEEETLRFLKNLPSLYEDEIEGKSLYMVHAQPPAGCHGGIKLLDKEGKLLSENTELWGEDLKSFDYDVLVVGHTHQVYAEYLSETLVINPGSTVFNHSCAILHLPELKVEWVSLSGKKIQTTWNWGEHVIYGR